MWQKILCHISYDTHDLINPRSVPATSNNNQQAASFPSPSCCSLVLLHFLEFNSSPKQVIVILILESKPVWRETSLPHRRGEVPLFDSSLNLQ